MDDITVSCGDGIVNIRVGAIIIKEGKLSMATNSDVDYLYSIGGRIKFGETAETALKREVKEELGVNMEVDRLAIVHENYFWKTIQGERILIYEIAFYYFMKTYGDFVINTKTSELEKQEYYEWVDLSDHRKMYPRFLFEYAFNHINGIVHICTDERKKGNDKDGKYFVE